MHYRMEIFPVASLSCDSFCLDSDSSSRSLGATARKLVHHVVHGAECNAWNVIVKLCVVMLCIECYTLGHFICLCCELAHRGH